MLNFESGYLFPEKSIGKINRNQLSPSVEAVISASTRKASLILLQFLH